VIKVRHPCTQRCRKSEETGEGSENLIPVVKESYYSLKRFRLIACSCLFDCAAFCLIAIRFDESSATSPSRIPQSNTSGSHGVFQKCELLTNAKQHGSFPCLSMALDWQPRARRRVPAVGPARVGQTRQGRGRR
jgi:hypothetical protein